MTSTQSPMSNSDRLYARAVAFAVEHPRCTIFDIERALFITYRPAQRIHKRLIADGLIDGPVTIPAQVKR